jgi:NADH:ubiquinone oxidoreductase subunit K
MSFWAQEFWSCATAAALVFVAGLYCILASRNLIRILIGVELLTKAVTLLIVLAGAITGRIALAQALVITLVFVEVIAIAVGAAIVIGAWREHGTVDAKALTNLKG